MLKRMKLYWNQLFRAQQDTPQGCTSFDSALENSTAPRTKTKHVPHSKSLIPNLKNDHQIIFNIYTEIFNAIETEQFDCIHEILKRLKNCLELHLIQENTHFYGYLEQHYAQQPEQLDIVKFAHQDMKQISTHIFQFIHIWQDQQIDRFNLLEFSQEYKHIGHILMQRIAQEENEIYTLYPPYID